MKVYLLLEIIPYEGSDVIAVFSSREKALNAMKEGIRTDGITAEIEEFEIDCP